MNLKLNSFQMNILRQAIANPPSFKDQTKDYLLCTHVLELVPQCIEYVLNPSEELCLIAVKKDGSLLSLIRQPSAVVCLAAVLENPMALRSVPPNKVTEEMCLIAVKQDNYAITYVKSQDDDICSIAIKYHPKYISQIKNPSESICLKAVSLDGTVLENIKKPSNQTCQAAVKQNPYALRHVPKKQQTISMCVSALERSTCCLPYIKLITPSRNSTSAQMISALKKMDIKNKMQNSFKKSHHELK